MRPTVFFRVTTQGRKRFETLVERDAVTYARVLNLREKRGAVDKPYADVEELPVVQPPAKVAA